MLVRYLPDFLRLMLIFSFTDTDSLRTLAQRTTEEINNASQPYSTQRSALSDLQKFVKRARSTIVDPILIHFENMSSPEPESEEEMARIGRTFDVPLLANMVEGGRTPVLDRKDLEALGFKIAIFPTSGFLAAGAAMRSIYQQIRSTGSSKSWTGDIYAFDEFCRLMGFERIWQFEREHAETK